MNDTINTKEKNNDVKGITFLAIGIMTIVAAIAGASYAYFQVTATNSNTIKGDSAYTANSLTLAIDTKTPVGGTNQTAIDNTGTKKLIPQLTSAIASASNATNKCVDTNGNAICKHYAIKITNNTTNTFFLEGTLALTAASMSNLRWRTCTAANACGGSVENQTSTTSLGSRIELEGGESTTLYVVIWIRETGSAQTDSGNFTGTVTFTGYNATTGGQTGITSTITS